MSRSADEEKVNECLLPTNVDKSDSRIDLKTYGDVLKNTPTPRSNGTGPQIRTPSFHHSSKPSSSNIQVTNNVNSVNITKKSGLKDGEEWKKNPQSINFQPTDFNEVFNTITQLKDTSSTGNDGMPFRMLKVVANEIAGPLTHIVILIFVTGEFPSVLKCDVLRAIYKKGP
ncbi:hypothetical protein HHI36_010280 [Cryptolaemus montrouzieri]|uniref:Uncharacterized protein n=1 Tax=Cryptolaemus montrouzieri TaxID=559131 RepID=A0ABD2MIA7_9CUCU